jgi:FkbM family methyltransferase
MYRILYGTPEKNIDITIPCQTKCMKNNIIRIPSSDFMRAFIFTDPYVDVLKSIIIEKGESVFTYDHTMVIYIDNSTQEIFTQASTLPDHIKETYPDFTNVLRKMHQQLKLDYGSFQDEYPEQLLAVEYITGTENVLEIGGNIGRNSLIIASILNDHNNTNLVTLECCSSIAAQLSHNRNKNNLFFHVENAALSKTDLYQPEGQWQTVQSNVPLVGHTKLNTITFDELEKKYKIQFDTLVMDCEGAFYYILQEMPDMLKNIKLIIMENDYNLMEHKEFVDRCLMDSGLHRVHWEAGGWGPCFHRFYEVWKR